MRCAPSTVGQCADPIGDLARAADDGDVARPVVALAVEHRAVGRELAVDLELFGDRLARFGGAVGQHDGEARNDAGFGAPRRRGRGAGASACPSGPEAA